MGDERIIELLTDMLHEMREMKQEQQMTNSRLQNVEGRLEKLENQQMKTNVALGELRLAVTKLADSIEQVYELNRRVTKLEAAVFK